MANDSVVNELVEIARFSTAAEAAIAQSHLDALEIPACLDGEAMAGWFGYLGSAIGGVKLLVKQQDSQRAVAILASIAAEEATDEFGENPTADEDSVGGEPTSDATRAFRASLIGILLLPPLLNIYSTYLIFRHRLFQRPRDWQVSVALFTNGFVFLLVGSLIFLSWRPREPMPILYGPEGEPLEMETLELPTMSYPVVP